MTIRRLFAKTILQGYFLQRHANPRINVKSWVPRKTSLTKEYLAPLLWSIMLLLRQASRSSKMAYATQLAGENEYPAHGLPEWLGYSWCVQALLLTGLAVMLYYAKKDHPADLAILRPFVGLHLRA